ncbi:hypothetical protein BKP45_13600 [Anaerobacillus alkalidiazotrophicus]|uniref:histidine kinase n=1 Tax=Anaerobacillus alkalidiazotrophicus TaxID=472963 RepID=A0A1S2M402_9BACI|nr:sensor histidine kinase [Anaerobacillus alkalidiazotrophicus]OIJ19193.1 hypothetical protein BKP45_13600 [Anaerobacillus alkalidiazotrophicus]
MNKKLLLNFLKDHLLFTFALFGSSALVITFFWLQANHKIEVIYPFILVSFVYLIFMIIRAYRYITFHQLIENANGRLDDVSLKRTKWTEEQRMVIEKIKSMEDDSLAKVNQLEMQNENKYKIISQIIHNIKTPTSVIDLMVQYSQTEKTNAHEVIIKINKENQLINEHLDQALHYLRLDYFQHDFSIEKTDLIQHLREIINVKKDQFIYNQVFPQWNVDENSIYVLTDKKWNKILLDQLISNAIKYTALKPGEKRVSFHVQCKEDRVLLFIEDTGIGISEHDLKRVCEPFFTGENGRKIRNASGIGLYLSKSISDKMNHQMGISSKVDKGTIVTLTYLTKM